MKNLAKILGALSVMSAGLLSFAALLLWASLSFAATTSVTLAWDANTEPDVAGYKLYQAPVAGGPYTLAQTVGRVTTTTVVGLADGNHCWVLTAFDGRNESGYSNEACSLSDTVAPGVPHNVQITITVRVQ